MMMINGGTIVLSDSNSTTSFSSPSTLAFISTSKSSSMENGVNSSLLNGSSPTNTTAAMPDLKKIKIEHDQFGVMALGSSNNNNSDSSTVSTTSAPQFNSSSSSLVGAPIVSNIATCSSGSASLTASSSSSEEAFKSRVVHLRNIPSECTANDLFTLAAPFGSVTKHLLVRSRGQAFIEFAEFSSALSMVNYWVQTTMIGGVPMPLQPTIR